jgi:hypothetical protein
MTEVFKLDKGIWTWGPLVIILQRTPEDMPSNNPKNLWKNRNPEKLSSSRKNCSREK